ncbi:MAG: hypothetical protein ACJAWA_000706 [Nonlabens sp.]|jgi:hypothetical protein
MKQVAVSLPKLENQKEVSSSNKIIKVLKAIFNFIN